MKLNPFMAICWFILITNLAVAQSTLYGIIGDRLVTIDPATAQTTEIAQISPGFENFSGMTYHADLDKILMVADRSSNPRLIALDRCTGAIEEIGLIDLPDTDLQLIEAMEYNPNDGLLYAAGEDTPPPANFFSPRLMIIDPATGNATQIGEINGTCQDESDGFAFTTGATYTMDGCPDPENLYTIDLSTGETTFIGASNVQGTAQVTVDPASGLLYSVNPTLRQLFSISPTDATTTLIGNTHSASEYDGNLVTVMTFAPSLEISCQIDPCEQDSLAPTVLCENISIVADSSGMASITPEDIDNGSFDDCAIDSIWVEPSSLNCGETEVLLVVRDSSQNIDSCIAIVTVLDETAPAIVCPPDTTVACSDTATEFTGMAIASDNCTDSVSISFEDVILSGEDCSESCVIERTWTATDDSGNSSSCIQTITQSPLQLIEDALGADLDGDGTADPIQLGILHHTLTIGQDAAGCILQWLPGADAPAWPLPRENAVVDPSDCTPGANPLAADGQLMNPLIAEVLLLDIKLRLQPDLGATLLETLGCPIHPVLYQYMPNNPTIQDLYELSQIALGSLIGPPHLEHLRLALNCLNSIYDLCDLGNILEPEAPVIKISHRTAERSLVQLFPNPATDVLNILFNKPASHIMQIEIMDINGRKLYQLGVGEIADRMSIKLNEMNLSNGLYIINIYSDGGVVSRRFVKN